MNQDPIYSKSWTVQHLIADSHHQVHLALAPIYPYIFLTSTSNPTSHKTQIIKDHGQTDCGR